MYPLRTSLILLGMVVTGAARSVGVKLLYQLGFDNYLFVALLYLFGQSMALVVYGVSHYWACCNDEDDDPQHEYERVHVDDDNNIVMTSGQTSSESSDDEDDASFILAVNNNNKGMDKLSELELQPIRAPNDENDETDSSSKISQPQHSALLLRSQSAPTNFTQEETENAPTTTTPPSHNHHQSHLLVHAQSMPLTPPTKPPLRRRGSKTGLTQESHDAVAWVHAIPWQLKPCIPGLFNLANAALKWASFIYVAASIAEILMAGLELVLSVVVARAVRKRTISPTRWAGVAVVGLGLWLVHAADVFDAKQHDNGDSDNSENSEAVVAQLQRQQIIGALLIVGQCVTAVGQDMAEELFLHEADFPATLLLGMEGLYGLVFGIPLYLRYAPEAPLDTLHVLAHSEWKSLYVVTLTLIFTVTGIFNIMTTEVTSSMTRNMWKNCRTILVWVLGLILFYNLHNDHLGEKWVVPDSFFILGGFLVMLSGIYIYYKHK